MIESSDLGWACVDRLLAAFEVDPVNLDGYLQDGIAQYHQRIREREQHPLASRDAIVAIDDRVILKPRRRQAATQRVTQLVLKAHRAILRHRGDA